jgi:putative membrane protein
VSDSTPAVDFSGLGGVHVDMLVGVTLLGVAYVWRWVRHGGRPAGTRFLCFYGALLSLVLTLNGPLHDLGDLYLFSAHMVQHLVLTLVFPPLLLLGTPAWMADALLAPLLRRPVVGALVRTLVRPLPALGFYTAALVLWHLPAAYDAALRVHGWHIVQHLTLMGGAVLAWWPVLSPSTLAPSLPYGAQILYLFVFGMPMTVVAAMITGAERVLYTAYAEAPRVVDLSPLADQRLGGVLMWVPAGLIPLFAFTAVFFRWAAAEADP